MNYFLRNHTSISSIGLSCLLLFLAANRMEGQTPFTTSPSTSSGTTSSTNAATSTAPTAVTLPNVVAEADAITLKLNDIKVSLDSDTTLKTVEANLAQITHDIDEQQSEDGKVLSANTSLATLRTARVAWQTSDENLSASKKILVDRLTVLDGQIKQLAEWLQTWQATLKLAQSSAAPPDILARINNVLTTIGVTTQSAQALRTQTLSEQSRVSEQGARIVDALTAIQKAQASAVQLLFVRDSPPLWSPEFASTPASGTPGQNSFASQMQGLWSYLQEKATTLLMHFLGFILLAATLVWLRREVDTRAKDDPGLQHVAKVFDVPLATAALIALLVSGWLYPLAPRLLLAFAGAAALVPAVIILRRLIQPSLFPVLYAMVIFYILDQLRYVTSSVAVVARSIFIFELLAGALFLLWLIRSHGAVAGPGQRKLAEKVVRISAHLNLLLFVFSGMANALGYLHLAILVGSATLSSNYLAVITYAAVRIADALTLWMLQIRPFTRMHLVKRQRPLLTQNLFLVFRWGGAAFWLWETLELFSLRTPLWIDVSAILKTTIGWNTHVIMIGDILAFGVTVWASFFISKLIRFLLEEEVFPNLQLPAGVPYTASTLAHYTVLLVGFFTALGFLKINLSSFAVLAGAFGVGLGFGLQNIMNNFISGIILLFERPIKVGDIIQVDTAVGTVESIGIRASIIRLTNGSEVIVPNGNLISNQVINWTFSNRQRVVDLPVTVVSKTNPQVVIALLIKIAQNHPLVLKDPPPQAVVTAFTAAALTLELRAWTNNPNEWTQIRSDLSVAINTEFLKENIAIG